MQKMGHLILPKTGHLSVPLTLEDHIEGEQRDIEELELYLDMVTTGAVAPEVNLRVV